MSTQTVDALDLHAFAREGVGATHDAAGDKGGKGGSKGRAKAQTTADDPRGGLPPRVVPEVTTEGGAHRGTQLPIEGGITRSKNVSFQEGT